MLASDKLDRDHCDMTGIKILFDESAVSEREAQLLRVVFDLHVTSLLVAYMAQHRGDPDCANLAERDVALTCASTMQLIERTLPGLHPTLGRQMPLTEGGSPT